MMKIVACKSCGKGYFKNVSVCPHCGVMNKSSMGIRKILVCSFIALCVLVCTYLWVNWDNVIGKVINPEVQQFDLDFDKSNWSSTTMSETENYWLYKFNKDSNLNISSINIINSALNVVRTSDGGSRLSISILLTKDKKSVIALQSNQRVECKASKCSFRVMFDNLRRDIFEFTPIDNGKSNSILVIKSEDFLEKIKKSKKITIYINMNKAPNAKYMFITQNLNTTF